MRLCRSSSQVLGPLVASLALAATGGAYAQGAGPLLVISQPSPDTPKDSYIDLAPHIEPKFREGGKIDAFVFRPGLPAVKALLDCKALEPADVKPPLTKASAHKVARALGARYILLVSAYSTKEGLAATADTEASLTLDQWTTLSTDKILPAKARGKSLSLLESVHILVSTLVDKVQNAIARGPAPTGPRPGVPQVADRVSAKDRAEKLSEKNTAASPAVTENPIGAPSNPPTPAGPTASNAPPVRPANAPSTYELLIDKARRNGDTANLLIALRRAVTDRPRDVRLRRDLVKAYQDRGWHDMAREEASRAVELAPDDSALHRLLGDAMLEIGETEAALKEFQAAVKLSPNDAAAYISLGDAYANLGKPDESLIAYEDASRADPKSPGPPRRLARIYGLKGKYAECVAALNLAKSLTPAEDMTSFREDHAALLNGLESILSEVVARLANARKLFVNGSKNREETHKEVTSNRKRAEEIAGLLEQMPDVGFARVQALYGQAATLIGQSAEKYLDYLESQNTPEDEEASLIRIEASKQLADASKTLKAQLAPKK